MTDSNTLKHWDVTHVFRLSCRVSVVSAGVHLSSGAGRGPASAPGGQRGRQGTGWLSGRIGRQRSRRGRFRARAGASAEVRNCDHPQPLSQTPYPARGGRSTAGGGRGLRPRSGRRCGGPLPFGARLNGRGGPGGSMAMAASLPEAAQGRTAPHGDDGPPSGLAWPNRFDPAAGQAVSYGALPWSDRPHT